MPGSALHTDCSAAVSLVAAAGPHQYGRSHHFKYMAPTALLTGQCGQGLVFGAPTETVLWTRGDPVPLDSIAALADHLEVRSLPPLPQRLPATTCTASTRCCLAQPQ